MPRRSKVTQLPQGIREELERRLIAGGFAGYRELADWLKEHGFAISKSALHEWGQTFEDRLSALKVVTEQARAVVEAAPDEEGALNDALIRLVQEKLFLVLAELQVDPKRIKLDKVAKMVADLARPAIAQKRWATEARAKLDVALRQVEEEAKRQPLSPAEALARVRSLYGLEP